MTASSPTPSRFDGPPPGRCTVTASAAPASGLLREWDALVRAQPLADVAQLSGWGRLRVHAGFSTRYVFVHRDGVLAAGAQLLVRRLPGVGRVGYLPYGPLVAAAGDRADDPHRVLAAALEAAGRRQLRMLFVQPVEGDERTSQLLLDRGFRYSDADIAPTASLRVDLDRDEAELRRGLSKGLRRLIPHWPAKGVTVRQAGEEDVPVLAGLLALSAEHQGFTPFGEPYLRAMYRELAPEGHVVAFIGELHGRPVAMCLLTGCGSVLRTRLVGLERSEGTRQLGVPAAVTWTAMTWAKRNGYRWFDFGGLLPQSVPLLLSGGAVDVGALPGPDRYKARFGGQAYRYPPAVELIASPVVRVGYDLVRRSAAGRHLVARVKRAARAGSAGVSRDGGRPSRARSSEEDGSP